MRERALELVLGLVSRCEELHAEGEGAMSSSPLKLALRCVGVAAFFAGTSVTLPSSAEDVTVPTSVTMKVYRFGLSTSPTCENMQIYDVEAPAFVDFTTNPTLGSASVPHGTYHCVALEIDQIVSGTPRTSAGNCTTDKALSYDYCALLEAYKRTPPPSSDADGGMPSPPGNTLDGILPLGGDASQIFETCKAGGDHFTVYLTTQIPVVGPSNPFRPPTSATDTSHGFHLGAPLVVTERTTGTFVVSAVAHSETDGCVLGAGTFSFESSD
jgi:hypothetical protein